MTNSSLTKLRNKGWNIQTNHHASAIFEKDFTTPLDHLCDILINFRIKGIELIQGGGGEAKSTQRLRRTLTKQNWKKHKFVISKTIDRQEKTHTTHEIDHVYKTDKGHIALEIEWNNKDTFFDRDLENFQRLHIEGAISLGVIITRGQSLQSNLQDIIKNWATNNNIKKEEDLQRFDLKPTDEQCKKIKDQMNKKLSFLDAWSKVLANKFSTSSTHWDKLSERIKRGVGSPCPLLLLGIPKNTIQCS